MDIATLPFNRLIGLESSNLSDDYLISLPSGPQHENHLSTVHGSALLAVAEAASGVFLVKHFGEFSGYLPVVRRLEAKFIKLARGRILAQSPLGEEDTRAWKETLHRRGRALMTIPIEVSDSSGDTVMTASVDWFISSTEARS